MNGAHDCGGMMGFGAVATERDEPVFHSAWESRAFALMSAVGDIGGWTLDEDRSACESMHPADYAATSYYEHWLHGLQVLLVKHGLVTAEELADGMCRTAPVARQPTQAPAVWGLRDCARKLCARTAGAGPLCCWRPGQDPAPEPCRAYAPAALPARPCGRDRRPAWCPCLSRQQCSRPRRRSRSGSIPCGSPAANCGARGRAIRSMPICGSPILKLSDLNSLPKDETAPSLPSPGRPRPSPWR